LPGSLGREAAQAWERVGVKVLITGAAGNLGSSLARYLLDGPNELRLLIHRRALPDDVASSPNVSVYRANLEDSGSLADLCRDIDCVVHFAGVLFAPRPAKFLPRTNVEYVRNLVIAALTVGVRKFVLISFPHVEGESSPDHPAIGRLDGKPTSVHAQTRLAAERYLFTACEGREMVPVVLRAGMIYGHGLRLSEAARWLLRHRLLSVWNQPTWIHLLALPDFLRCVASAIEGKSVSGIYNLGDDRPLTLQECLDTVATHWGVPKPWRCPRWLFYAAGWCCEAFATVFGTAAPLTRDVIRIGMASSVADTSPSLRGR